VRQYFAGCVLLIISQQMLLFSRDRIRKINNVPWLIVPIGAVIIPLVCYFFLRQSNTKGSADNADDEASGEYALSVVITGIH